jgi:hypothetical protein
MPNFITPTTRIPEWLWRWSDIYWQVSEISGVELDVASRLGPDPMPASEPFKRFSKVCQERSAAGLALDIRARNIQVDVRKLLSLFPESSDPESAPRNPGVLPTESHETDDVPLYLAFMLRARRELGLGSKKRLPKKHIEDWIKDNWTKELGKFSQAKAGSMATFLRDPEDQKGGHYKSSGNR